MKASRGSSDTQSTVQMKRRSATRKRPPALIVKWNEKLGLPECPYVTRWRIEAPRLGSIRVHHWTGPDDDRAFHDHPWWFLTFVVKGGYIDHHQASDHVHADRVQSPAVRFRPALHRHTVIPDVGGAWTILITGPRSRSWGFWQDGKKFYKARRWFESKGHHPCAED